MQRFFFKHPFLYSVLYCILIVSCKEKDVRTITDTSGFHAAFVYPKYPFIMLGDTFHAQIYLEGRPKMELISITIDSINGKVISKIKLPIIDGIGYYNDKPDIEGMEVFSGSITVKDANGKSIEIYPFHSYYVASRYPLIISPKYLMSLYIGIPNPIIINAPGFADSALLYKFNGPGTISGVHENFIVNIDSLKGKPGDTGSISVSVNTEYGGYMRLCAPVKFKIKRLPDPICYIDGRKGDCEMSKEQIESLTGITLKMEDSDFMVNYKVVGFEMSTVINGVPMVRSSNSNEFTSEMKQLIKLTSRGSSIIIKNVHISGPDKRIIPGPVITIN